MTRLTEDQIEILRSGASGVSVNYETKWLRDGRPAGRDVKKLIRLGYVDATYYRGGQASAWATDKGREVLKSLEAGE